MSYEEVRKGTTENSHIGHSTRTSEGKVKR